MSRNRKKLGLAALLVLLMGAVASAQGLRDMQLFATVDQSRYGGGQRPNEGYFFTFDGLVWSISAANQTDIGKNGLTRNVTDVPELGYPTLTLTYPLPVTVERSSLTNAAFSDGLVGGTRYNFGYVTGHHGWMFSGFQLHDYNQDAFASNASVVFDDAPLGLPIPVLDASGAPGNITSRLQGYYDDGLTTGGNLPVRFDELVVDNKVDTWGLEMSYVYRFHPCHNGGIFEFSSGVRYLEFDEDFNVQGMALIDDTTTYTNNILNQSYWYTDTENHIIGPQLGLRWFRSQNRWTWDASARYFSGYNDQEVNQRAVLADKLVPTSPATPGQPVKLTSTVNSQMRRNLDEWSHNAELRLNLKYQLTRSVTFRVGWTGTWLNAIARPANMVDYSLHADGSILGILDAQNRQDVFMNGFTIGVGVNR